VSQAISARHLIVMRPWIIGLLLLSAGCAGGNASLDPRPAGGYHVLFIGNSLTYVNDLPGTVAALASSVDDTIRVESVTRPNFALIDHVNGMSDAVEVIGRGDWDYVVLQQGPTTQQIGRDTLILAVRLLDPEIRAAGGRPATLMVWPPSGNRAAFDQVLASYRQAADSVAVSFSRRAKPGDRPGTPTPISGCTDPMTFIPPRWEPIWLRSWCTRGSRVTTPEGCLIKPWSRARPWKLRQVWSRCFSAWRTKPWLGFIQHPPVPYQTRGRSSGVR
jgi:hypothetical protein